MLIRGTNLGNSSATGVAAFATGTASGSAFGNPIGGGGADGSTNMSIRPDILVDTTTTGLGQSFAVRGTTAPYYIRPIAANEYNTGSIVTVGTTVVNSNHNFLVNSVQPMFSTPYQQSPFGVTFNTVVNSLTLDGTAGISAPSEFFVYNGLPTIAQLSVTSGGIFARAGSTNTINVGILGTAPNGTNGSNQMFFHAFGNIDFTGYLNEFTQSGVASDRIPWSNKTGSGTLTINSQQYNNGGWTISDGAVVLNSTAGNNILPVLPATARYGYYDVWLNGGTLDLHGNNQSVMNLRSQGTYPGAGGTVTNTAGDVTFMAWTNANSFFAGSITDTYDSEHPESTGKLSFVATSDGATKYLVSPQTYHGSTTVVGGGLDLRDNGSIMNTDKLDLNYTTLTLNNQFMGDITRIPSNIPITMRGSNLVFAPAQGKASTVFLATDLETSSISVQEGFNPDQQQRLGRPVGRIRHVHRQPRPCNHRHTGPDNLVRRKPQQCADRPGFRGPQLALRPHLHRPNQRYCSDIGRWQSAGRLGNLQRQLR